MSIFNSTWIPTLNCYTWNMFYRSDLFNHYLLVVHEVVTSWPPPFFLNKSQHDLWVQHSPTYGPEIRHVILPTQIWCFSSRCFFPDFYLKNKFFCFLTFESKTQKTISRHVFLLMINSPEKKNIIFKQMGSLPHKRAQKKMRGKKNNWRVSLMLHAWIFGRWYLEDHPS